MKQPRLNRIEQRQPWAPARLARRRSRVCLFVHLAAFAVVAGQSIAATVATLDGRTLEGDVTAWSATGLTIATAQGLEQLASDELLDVRWSQEVAEAAAALNVEFVDGTRTGYAEFTTSKQDVILTGPRFDGPYSLPRDRLRLVELQVATPPVVATLEEVQRKELVGDVIVVAKRDGQSMDYLTGVVGDVTADQVSFEWDGEQTPVKRTRIAAILFYQAEPKAFGDAVCRLTLADGALINARDVTLSAGKLTINTPANVTLFANLSEIARADFSSGKLAYLSDLKPSESVWTPRIALPSAAQTIAAFGEPRRNQSFAGSPLSLLWKNDVARSRRDVRTYDKGLAIRSRTELTYRVPDGMHRFLATAGIDPETANQGHVVLQVRGDDRVLWEGPISGGQPPQEIDVEVASARRLQLTVDYGENLDYGDRLHLVEARFTK